MELGKLVYIHYRICPIYCKAKIVFDVSKNSKEEIEDEIYITLFIKELTADSILEKYISFTISTDDIEVH